MQLTVKEYDPIEAKKERELEIKKRRKQYKLPLSYEIREEILRRCKILRYEGDASIMSNYYESTDQELVDDYSWVLDSEHDDHLGKPYTITI